MFAAVLVVCQWLVDKLCIPGFLPVTWKTDLKSLNVACPPEFLGTMLECK